MFDLLSIRNLINTAIGNELGDYVLPDNTKIKAIAVLPDSKWGFNYPPANIKVTGVEAAIVSLPEKTTLLHGRDLQQKDRCEIHLKFWSNSHKMRLITNTLIQILQQETNYVFDSPNYIEGGHEGAVIPTILIVLKECQLTTYL